MNMNHTLCEAENRPPISKIDDFIAGSIVFVTASSSFVVNGGAAYVANRLQHFQGPFTKLSLSQATADCGVLGIYALWTAPTMYSQTPLALSIVGMKVGQLSLLFWYASAYAMLIIAVNRFYAITNPSKYKSVFTNKVTNRIIALNWTLALAHTLVFFLPGCQHFYDPGYYMWGYNRCTWCGRFNMGFEVYYTGSVFFLTFLINMATLLGLMKHTAAAVNVGAPSAEEKRRRRRDLKFFFQTAANGSAFCVLVLSTNVVSNWSSGKWFYFITTTLCWEASHATNGWLFLLHKKVREGFVIFLKSGFKNVVEETKITPVAYVVRKERQRAPNAF